MNMGSYDDKCPRWLTTGQTPPVKMWAEHFNRSAKKRNFIYTKYLEERLAVCKAKYGFLNPEQIFGMAMGELNVPSCGFKINQNFLNQHKTNRRQSKSDSRSTKVSSRSYCLFEDAESSSSTVIVDDFPLHHQIFGAPSPQNLGVPSPPSSFFRNDDLYSDLTEMFEDVQIQPFKSLPRKTRPSDVSTNNKRRNIKSPKDNRLLNQFEVFKEMSNYSCELPETRKETRQVDKNEILNKSATVNKNEAVNKSILKSNTSKENVSKTTNFEKSVQFNDNLEEVREFDVFEFDDDAETSTLEYNSPVDDRRNSSSQEESQALPDSSVNDSSDIMDEDLMWVADEEIVPVEREQDKHYQTEQQIPIVENQSPENCFTSISPTKNTSQSVEKEIVVETTLSEDSLFENSQTVECEIVSQHSQNSLDESIIYNSFEGSYRSTSYLPLKNKSIEKLEDESKKTISIQENDICDNSLKSNTISSEQKIEVMKDSEHHSSVQDKGEKQSHSSSNDLENDYSSDSVESDEIEASNVVFNYIHMNEEDRCHINLRQRNVISQNSDTSDVAVDCIDLKDQIQDKEPLVEIARGDSDRNITSQNNLSSVNQSVEETERVEDNDYESGAEDSSDNDLENLDENAATSQVSSNYYQNNLSKTLNEIHIEGTERDDNMEVLTAVVSVEEDVNEEILRHEFDELDNECPSDERNQRKQRLYFDSVKIPICAADEIEIDELFQEPPKKEQHFYESASIPICHANKIIDKKDRDMGPVPEESDLSKHLEREVDENIEDSDSASEIDSLSNSVIDINENEIKQPYHYESTKIPIVPENKLIESINSDGESHVSYFQSKNIPILKEVQQPKELNTKQVTYLQSATIPIHPENRGHSERRMESAYENDYPKDRISYFDSNRIPIRNQNKDENLSEGHISSQLLEMEAKESMNEEFDLNSNSSSELSDTAKKVARKRHFSSIFGNSFRNMGKYLSGNDGSPSSNDDRASTNYDLSLDDMNCEDNSLSNKESLLLDRSSSFNIPSVDDEYQMIKSDDSLAEFCNALRKPKTGADIVDTSQMKKPADDESLASSLELTYPKRRRRNMDKTAVLQSSTKDNVVLTSQTTNITDYSSKSHLEVRQLICNDWIAQNEFFQPNPNNWLRTIGAVPTTDPMLRIPDDDPRVLSMDDGGEENCPKLPDFEFSSSEY